MRHVGMQPLDHAAIKLDDALALTKRATELYIVALMHVISR